MSRRAHARLDRPFARAKEELQRRLEVTETADRIRRDMAYEISKAGGAKGALIVEHPNSACVGKSLAEVAGMHGDDGRWMPRSGWRWRGTTSVRAAAPIAA